MTTALASFLTDALPLFGSVAHCLSRGRARPCHVADGAYRLTELLGRCFSAKPSFRQLCSVAHSSNVELLMRLNGRMWAVHLLP